MELRQYLYVSRLAPGAQTSDVTDIVRTARTRNAIAGITGLLLFNGDAFCQYVEGPALAMAPLLEALATDARHDQVTVLHDALVLGVRRMPTWALGYAYDEGAFDDLRGLRGEDALQAFERLAAAVDVGLGTEVG